MPVRQLRREQLMAYRILASGLGRSGGRLAELPVWDLGLQDRDGSAAAALAARLDTPSFDRWAAGGRVVGNPGQRSMFALAWTLRGSPHYHRRKDLQAYADVLWPADDSDGKARLGGSAKALQANGTDPLVRYMRVAGAMRRLVTEPMRKGELSGALTTALPTEFSAFCQPCGVVHVPEMLFRSAALPAGLGLLTDRPATLQALSPAVSRPVSGGTQRSLIDAYLRLYGGGTPASVAAHLGTSPARLKPDWPETVSMSVDSSALQSTAELLEHIADADADQAAGLVRLLPNNDPLLQPRERALLMPDRTHWKTLWPSISPAGAVLANGELVAGWRKRKAKWGISVTVTPFQPLGRRLSGEIEVEAAVVAASAGASDASVSFD